MTPEILSAVLLKLVLASGIEAEDVCTSQTQRPRGRHPQEQSSAHKPDGRWNQTCDFLSVRSGRVTNGSGARPARTHQTKPKQQEVTQPLAFPTAAATATTPGNLTATRLNHSAARQPQRGRSSELLQPPVTLSDSQRNPTALCGDQFDSATQHSGVWVWALSQDH